MRSVLFVWADRDPLAALDQIDALDDEALRSSMRAFVVGRLAQRDAAATLRYFDSLDDSAQRETFRSGLWQQRAATAPELVLERAGTFPAEFRLAIEMSALQTLRLRCSTSRRRSRCRALSRISAGAIPTSSTRPEFKAPAAFWNPVISPSSLMFYSGGEFPEWQGDAFIGGLSSQSIVRIEFDGENAREAERFAMGMRVRALEQEPDGAIWMLEDEREGRGGQGRLFRLTARN